MFTPQHVLFWNVLCIHMWLRPIHTCFLCLAERIPLYPGAPISCKESWISIYEFAVSHRLPDSATQDLLKLISDHCPLPNHCPQTVYKLKKTFASECAYSQYCSVCMELVPPNYKQCTKQNCAKKDSKLCYYTLLPFDEQLKEIFAGM